MMSGGAIGCSCNTSALLVSCGYGDEIKFLELTITDEAEVKRFSVVKSQKVDECMTWISFDDETGNLYAAHQVSNYGEWRGTGVVSRWELDRQEMQFVKKEVKPTGGVEPAHLQVDRVHRLLLVSNYGGGSFVAFSLVGPSLSVGDVVFRDSFSPALASRVHLKQDRSHPHGAWLYRDKFVYVPDLGTDSVYTYEVVSGDKGPLRRLPFETKVEAGRGPRHILVDEGKNRVYLLNELRPVVDVFSADADTGRLKHLASVRYAIEGADFSEDQKGAGIAFHPVNGDVVYISHRGFGTVVSFDVSPDPAICLVQRQVAPTSGVWNRTFAFAIETAMAVASQYENLVEIFVVEEDGSIVSDKDGSVKALSENQPTALQVIGRTRSK